MKSLTTALGLALFAAPVAAHTDAGMHLHPHVSDGATAWMPLLSGMAAIVVALALTATRATLRARSTRKPRK